MPEINTNTPIQELKATNRRTKKHNEPKKTKKGDKVYHRGPIMLSHYIWALNTVAMLNITVKQWEIVKKKKKKDVSYRAEYSEINIQTDSALPS